MTGSEDTSSRPMPERIPMSGIYDSAPDSSRPARAERPALEDLIGSRVAQRLDAISREVGFATSQISVEFPFEEIVAEVTRRVVEQMRGAAQDEGALLTTAEAAAYLRASEQRIYDLVTQRRLRPEKDGRRNLFRRADLDAYLSRRSRG